MDFKFNVSGLMNVDVVKYKVFNETQDGIFEWEYNGKLYNMVLALEVFDMESKETSYIVGDSNLAAEGFSIHDYSDVQWELENESFEISKNSSEGININDLN
jgi:hypothetical protein